MSDLPASPAASPLPSSHLTKARAVAEIALVVLIFALQAGLRVPEINEPYYLGKAKHFWNANWCAGDFFLESRDAHQVFCWTVGWFTQWLSLDTTALVGRLVTWTLLAVAWSRLAWTLSSRRGMAVISAGLFVLLLDRCHLAGEWVVGGVEAKGFAYVAVLCGLRALARNQWSRVWLWMGGAAAWHVLVGGWSVVACAVAWCLSRRDAPTLRSQLPALFGGFLLALPGLAPALRLGANATPDVIDKANVLYVFQRMPHHMAVHTLSSDERFTRFTACGLLLLGLVAFFRVVDWTPATRRLRGFIIGAVAIAFAGLAIGLALQDRPELAASLLRYYWFRLNDFALAMGAALLFAQWMLTDLATPRIRKLAMAVVGLAIVAHLTPTVLARARAEAAPANLLTLPEKDWIDACHWIAAETPPSSRFLTPRMSRTFNWYAERAEVVTQKNIPQDAAGIVAWWDRMDRVHRHGPKNERAYRKSLIFQGEPMLKRIANKYQADYLIVPATPELKFERVYRNDSFAVYRLR